MRQLRYCVACTIDRFIAMQFLEGKPLDRRIQRGRLRWEWVLGVALHLQGRSSVLHPQPGDFQRRGIPSPDGRYLAFVGWSTATNVWSIANF